MSFSNVEYLVEKFYCSLRNECGISSEFLEWLVFLKNSAQPRYEVIFTAVLAEDLLPHEQGAMGLELLA